MKLKNTNDNDSFPPEQIDRILHLQHGCCREACECEWVPFTKDKNGEFKVKLADARARWVEKQRPAIIDRVELAVDYADALLAELVEERG